MGKKKDLKVSCSLEVPDGSLLKVRAMVKDCCNYFNGECGVLDCDCVVQKDANINCTWFANCVLPSNPTLNKVILEHNDLGEKMKMYSKTCGVCGKKFKAESKTVQFCEKCAKKRKKELGAKRQKEYEIRQGLK